MRAETPKVATKHRNQCRFCGLSWSDQKPTTDCGGMDKFHKDKRWEEASPSPCP